MRYDFEHFKEGDLPATVKGVTFVYCNFEGVLPDFEQCEFHDCTMQGVSVRKLIDCKLYRVNLNEADFTSADVGLSLTHPGAPCTATGCKWQGIIVGLDCRWWQGLQIDDDAIWLLMAIMTIPITKDRETIYKMIPKHSRRKIDALMKKPFRTE